MITRTVNDVRGLLGPLDPAAAEPGSSTAADRRADLARIIATATGSTASPPSPRPGRGRARGRLAWAAGIAAVATTAVVAVVGNPLDRPAARAYAATPAPLAYAQSAGARPAKAQLEAIAARTRALPPTPRTGPYEHLTTVSWQLWTRIDGEQVTSAVVPSRQEMWRASDGAGRVVTSFEPPIFPDRADRDDWRRDGSPGGDAKREVQNAGPGELSGRRPDEPPTDLDAFRRWLAIGHPTDNGPAEVIVAVTDLVRDEVLDPTVRAQALQVLAELPGLVADGAVVDRAGRLGQAVSLVSDYSGLPTRYTLIVDPATGAVLGFEQTLTTTAGKLRVKVPAVIGYESFVTADYTAAIG